MSDGDRFDAFDELESGGEDDVDDTEDDPDPEPEIDRQPEPEPEPETSDSSSDGDIEDPAFSYAESNQGPIYARPETWDAYDDALELEMERELRDRGVRNAQKRELHDAVLRLAVENPERAVDLLIEARKES